jgi:hypothetical protein
MTRGQLAALLLVGALAPLSAASAGAANSSPTFALRGTPYLHTMVGIEGYKVVFRLNHPLIRRSNGSIDAGIETSAGFSDEITEIDHAHACYTAGVPGRARHGGQRATLRVLIGNGHDPIGEVHSTRDVVARLLAHTGKYRPTTPVTPDERRAAKRLGCTRLRA